MDSSIYKRIVDYLLEIINRNASIPNYKLPSERMLAANFDASRKPVRHAYEQLIERGYVVNIHGCGYFIRSDIKPDELLSAFQKNIRISFIIPSVLTRYSHTILAGVGDFCAANHVEYTIHVSENSFSKEAALLHSVSRSGSMGIILFPTDNDVAYYNELIRLSVRKYPFVLVDRSLPNISTSFISSDDHSAMVNAVKFLYEKHYQNPVFMVPPAALAASIDMRINGYTHGLLKYYKSASPRNLLTLGGTSAQQEAAVIKFLQQYPDTDVMILHGTQRLPVLSAMKNLGMQNIKLMIFDDELSPVERDILRPFFIQQDGYHIGYTAAEVLYHHILGDMRPVIKQIQVTITDSERESAASGEQSAFTEAAKNGRAEYS